MAAYLQRTAFRLRHVKFVRTLGNVMTRAAMCATQVRFMHCNAAHRSCTRRPLMRPPGTPRKAIRDVMITAHNGGELRPPLKPTRRKGNFQENKMDCLPITLRIISMGCFLWVAVGAGLHAVGSRPAVANCLLDVAFTYDLYIPTAASSAMHS